MDEQKRRVTMKDVAKEAGVSVMAVSKVLNQKGGISKETSQRVLRIAKELKYNSNSIAKSLRVDKTYTIGVMASDSSEFVFSKVLQGIENTAAEAGYSVIIANAGKDAQMEEQIVQNLISRRIDGLILAAPLQIKEEDFARLKDANIPFVILMRKGGKVPVDHVVNDNYMGGYTIVEYLLHSGSKEVTFLSLPEGSQSGQDRMRGYQQAFIDNGLRFDIDKVQYCKPYIQDGFEGMKRLLEAGMRKGSICCGCDLIAIGAMKAILDVGLRVPEDFRVTGYDDIDLAEYLMVPLTTMSQPKYEIGTEGVKLLLDRLENKTSAPKQVILASELVVRSST